MILLLSFLFLIFAILILIFKPSLIFILFALELILLGININLIFASIYLDDFAGQYFALILFSVAALDTCLGLIIILNYYNIRLIPHSSSYMKSIRNNAINVYKIPMKAYSTLVNYSQFKSFKYYKLIDLFKKHYKIKKG